MLTIKNYLCIALLPLCNFVSTESIAQPMDGLGQLIKIRTNFNAYVGRPSWTLIIRDIDNGQNIPYIFDIKRGANFWFAFTFGRNYLITVSNLQFSPYRHDPLCVTSTSKRINNFCNLETGRIIRGQSMRILIAGMLSPNPDTYRCMVVLEPPGYFTVVPNDLR